MSGKANARKMVSRAFSHLPDNVRNDVRDRRLEFKGIGQLKENQAMLALRLAELEKAQNRGPSPIVPVEDPRFPSHVRSRLCTQAAMDEPWYAKWSEAFHEPATAHRKTWEFTYIAEVLDALGMIAPGRRGLGFGVGREPLISAFAARGVEVVATDLAPESSEALGWLRSDQHADGGLDAMRRPEVVDAETFRKLVTWEPVDMRAIPSHLVDFDFCWSACSLEHLGTLDLGLEFIENSLKTLKPGGIAVHTTEFNVFSDEDTVEAGGTVVYRERDMIALGKRLEAAGHEVAAFDFSKGDGVLDQYVDVPPYKIEPVLRFLLGQYTLTSVAIVVRKKQA